MSKRIMVIRIRVSEEEYEEIYHEAERDPESRYRNGEINLSAYLRKCIFRGGEGWKEEVYRKELRDLTYQVRKAAEQWISIAVCGKGINGAYERNREAV